MIVSYPAMAKATVYTTAEVADDETVRTMLSRTVGGFTITYGSGGWTDSDGSIIVDKSAAIVLLHPDVSVLRRAVEAVSHHAIGVLGESEVWAEVDRDVHIVKFDDRSDSEGPAF